MLCVTYLPLECLDEQPHPDPLLTSLHLSILPVTYTIVSEHLVANTVEHCRQGPGWVYMSLAVSIFRAVLSFLWVL